MAKKTTTTRKTTKTARKSASKTMARRPTPAGGAGAEMSTSVLDGSMKSVIRSAFLRNN